MARPAGEEAEARTSAYLRLKPMNCPGHVQIFKNGLRSYRELPLRFAEFSAVEPLEPWQAPAPPDARALVHPDDASVAAPKSRWRRSAGQDERADPVGLQPLRFRQGCIMSTVDEAGEARRDATLSGTREEVMRANAYREIEARHPATW